MILRLFNKIRDIFASFISRIKLLFWGRSNISGSKDLGNGFQTKDQLGEEEEVFYDACETLGEEEEVFYDACETLGEEEEVFYEAVGEQEWSFTQTNNNTQNAPRKEHFERIDVQNKYYSLESGIKGKEITAMLALAFEVTPLFVSNSIDFSTVKLQKIQQVEDGYSIDFTDSNANTVARLYTSNLNIYFPKYFEKHGAGVFSECKYGIFNHVVIPLEVPKEVDIFTQKSWNPVKLLIQSRIPEVARIPLRACKKHVCFNFDLKKGNNVYLSLISGKVKGAAMSSIPCETSWAVKGVLIQESFVNEINRGINLTKEEAAEPIEVASIEQVAVQKIVGF